MALDLTGIARADRAGLLAQRDQLKNDIALFQKALADVERKLARLKSQPDVDVLPQRKYDLSEAGRERISLAARLRGLKNSKANGDEIKRIKARLEELRPIVEAERRRRLSARNRSRT